MQDYNSDSDIQLQYASYVDGETSKFEFKGITDPEKFGKSDKALISKELCAFSNSYGGVICIHQSSREAGIPALHSEKIELLFRRLETWTRDALEPPCPMNLKIVGGYILIEVGESKIKPHRTIQEREYYYRHESLSVPMPEIMIAALYKKGDFLTARINITPSINEVRDKKMLGIHIAIENLSTLAGTQPRFQLAMLANSIGLQDLKCDFISLIGKGVGSSRYSGFEIIGKNIEGQQPSIFSSNKNYSTEVLYPKDRTFFTLRKIIETSETPAWILIEAVFYYLESPRIKKKYLCIKDNNENIYNTSEVTSLIYDLNKLLA